MLGPRVLDWHLDGLFTLELDGSEAVGAVA